ncbi:MAG: hypothetical protein QGI83_24525, partial [Candidatus Latescibacteria bacterium]|nr:hypothetical protein [Candidatus Latescibacterota bacterium]
KTPRSALPGGRAAARFPHSRATTSINSGQILPESSSNPGADTGPLHNKFAISWIGWGIFRVKADLYFDDGRVERVSYKLTFD